RRAGASSAETFPVTIEQGTEPLRNRVAPNQIDSTVRFSEWKEPEKPKGFKAADQKNVDPVEPALEDCIVIGRVTIRPNPIAKTMEGSLTLGGRAAHEVLLDGERVLGDRAVSVVYEAIREQQQRRKVTK